MSRARVVIAVRTLSLRRPRASRWPHVGRARSAKTQRCAAAESTQPNARRSCPRGGGPRPARRRGRATGASRRPRARARYRRAWWRPRRGACVRRNRRGGRRGFCFYTLWDKVARGRPARSLAPLPCERWQRRRRSGRIRRHRSRWSRSVARESPAGVEGEAVSPPASAAGVDPEGIGRSASTRHPDDSGPGGSGRDGSTPTSISTRRSASIARERDQRPVVSEGVKLEMRAGCGKSARPVRREAVGNRAMANRTEAPTSKETALPPGA